MKNFKQKGYLIQKQCFDVEFIAKINNEIVNLKNTDIYYDKNKNIRRIEKLYDKGYHLTELNNVITKKLFNLFDEEYVIFKDKFNAKPPGGEGFFAHYDGVFKFIDNDNNSKNGWYKYAKNFLNVLIALDECNEENGTIEIADADINDFDVLYENTMKNGTPNLNKDVETQKIFTPINLKIGDIVIFKNTCAHRSKKNKTKTHRRNLYYTYNPLKEGSHYKKYFTDKNQSKNQSSKSLSGEI